MREGLLQGVLMDIVCGRAAAKAKISCVMSVPRLLLSDNISSISRSIAPAGVAPRLVTGAFWDQSLTNGIEDELEDKSVDYILTADYDSVVPPGTLEALLALMASSGFDCIAPLQVKRRSHTLLMSPEGFSPGEQTKIHQEWFDKPVQAVLTAHFGFTLFRRRVFEEIARPWFYSEPDEDGRWRKHHIDSDIGFWNRAKDAGLRIGMATRISIGHLETSIVWPSRQGGSVSQNPSDYFNNGPNDKAYGVLQ